MQGMEHSVRQLSRLLEGLRIRNLVNKLEWRGACSACVQVPGWSAMFVVLHCLGSNNFYDGRVGLSQAGGNDFGSWLECLEKPQDKNMTCGADKCPHVIHLMNHESYDV